MMHLSAPGGADRSLPARGTAARSNSTSSGPGRGAGAGSARLRTFGNGSRKESHTDFATGGRARRGRAVSAHFAWTVDRSNAAIPSTGVMRSSTRTNEAPIVIATNGSASSARTTRYAASPSSDSTSALGATVRRSFPRDHRGILKVADDQRVDAARPQRRAHRGERFCGQSRSATLLPPEPVGDLGDLGAPAPPELCADQRPTSRSPIAAERGISEARSAR